MMPGPESDRVLPAHVRQCIERIRDYTKGQRATFYDSHLVQDAVVHNLQTLAESTQRLSGSLKATEPAVPWSAISGFRNVLAHNYLGIDLTAVWSVVEKDLPELELAIERMAQALASTGDRS